MTSDMYDPIFESIQSEDSDKNFGERRVDACLKACEGISTEALEAGAVGKMRETLESLSGTEWVDLALDPGWSQRISNDALSLLEKSDG